MKSLWNDNEVIKYGDSSLDLRVYTSRLLGQEPALVMHGGGNTSVKSVTTDIFGDELEVLFVKGSGWDLATIEAEGFAPVNLNVLQKMARLDELSDTDMVIGQRAAMTTPSAPNPSVEAILHAIIPFKFVDHTHADSVVLTTNTPGREAHIKNIYGDDVLVIPYVMPGFILAKTVFELTRNTDWQNIKGMILLNHGVFSFADDARTSYENMIDLVSRAEDYLEQNTKAVPLNDRGNSPDLLALARLRKEVSDARGRPMYAILNRSPESLTFSKLKNVADLSVRGPLTPDHVIRTKRTGLCVEKDISASVRSYIQEYEAYFNTYRDESMTQLDPAPRWGVWPNQGTLSFGDSLKSVMIVNDICQHTVAAIQRAEQLESWKALPAKDIFEIEYWELEQAKLKNASIAGSFQGKIVMVTGAASGIGKACVDAFIRAGAVVAALDIDPKLTHLFSDARVLPIHCDVTDSSQLIQAIESTVLRFGGLDIIVSNAGNFPPGQQIKNLDDEIWDHSLLLNLTSHERFLKAAIPFLELGIDPNVVFIGSKNVPAPGKEAAAYSTAKAGLAQLARVAALELGKAGIRVNTVHPNAIFDTAIWTLDILESRAAAYDMTVDEYKCSNVLGVVLESVDVAKVVLQLCGDSFSKTTGAQIPIDGGQERVI